MQSISPPPPPPRACTGGTPPPPRPPAIVTHNCTFSLSPYSPASTDFMKKRFTYSSSSSSSSSQQLTHLLTLPLLTSSYPKWPAHSILHACCFVCVSHTSSSKGCAVAPLVDNACLLFIPRASSSSGIPCNSATKKQQRARVELVFECL
jgi:hypothetical protein